MYQYVDSYTFPSFIQNLDRDQKLGKASMGKVK